MPGPNVYKIVFGFTGSMGARWSENFFVAGSNVNDVLYVPDLAKAARLWLLHPTCTWATITASDVTNTRVTAMRRTNWFGQYPGPGVIPSYVAPSQTSLVCQLVGTSGGSRKLWLRGLPAYLVNNTTTSGTPIFGAGTLQAVKEYISSLAERGYGIRTLIKTSRFYVSAAAPGPTPTLTVLTYTVPQGVAPPTFAAGQNLIIAGADKKTLPGLHGTFTVLNTGANTVTIRYQLPNNAAPTSGLGYLRQALYNNVSVFDPALSGPAYWGAHDTRVFLLRSRGAKRADRIRTLA